jgi:hypothetical protein
MNKIFAYLGFCPSKESAQNFNANNVFESREQKWKPYYTLMTYTGALLLFTGIVPFYFEDTSISGVTDTILLHGKIGVTSFLLGVILLISGSIVPRILIKMRKLGV